MEGGGSEHVEATFDELEEGYWPYKMVEENGKFERDGHNFVLMNEKRPCYYQTTNSLGFHDSKIDANNSSKRDLTRTSGEYRGITLRQLRAIWANVNRRCVEEKWVNEWEGKVTPLTPETVSNYDIQKYVTIPFIKDTGKSFVEMLPSTAGAQRPRVHVSYSWKSSFLSILLSLEQYVQDFSRNHGKDDEMKGGGMTEDTPVWMLAFALSEEEKQKSYDRADPYDNVFTRSIEVSGFRTLCIVDKEGSALQRMWPLLEMYHTLMNGDDKNGSWIVYTPHRHERNKKWRDAVGLIAGGSTSDYSAKDTLERERHFPATLVKELIKFRVQDGDAFEEIDKKKILNAFAERDLEAEPVEEHERYNEINDAYRAHFTTPGTLQNALNNDDGAWKAMLEVMSKGNTNYGMRFDFREGRGWDKLQNEQALDLIRSLPRTIESLTIKGARFGPKFIEELAKWIRGRERNLKMLVLDDTLVGDACSGYVGRMAVESLERSLNKNEEVPRLELWGADMEAIRTLVQTPRIANSVFNFLDHLYDNVVPDYDKITFLQAALIKTEPPYFVSPDTSRKTIAWAHGLNDDNKAELLSSMGGSFVKKILNKEFTERKNLFITMVDLYTQITIVISISLYMDKNPSTVQAILSFCLSWTIFREVVQIMTSHVQEYIYDLSNIFEFVQIYLIFLTIIFLSKFQQMNASMNDDTGNLMYTNTQVDSLDKGHLVYTICAVWISLIFQLSDVIFPLSTFVTALKEITKELGPFVLTSVLITTMFAHMFRVEYFGENCPINTIDAGIWKCVNITESYWESISMFLTDGVWAFDADTFMTGKGFHLKIAYAFVVGVLLLNIVIAVVSNKFTDVQNDAENVFWLHRLSLVQELESLWTMLSNICSAFGLREKDCKFTYKQLEKSRGIKRFSFQVMPSKSEQEQFQANEKLPSFADWWFSTKGQQGKGPSFTERVSMFYVYSHWDEVMFPGKVFERICLGLKYDGSGWATKSEVLQMISIGFVRIIAWIVFIVHVLSAVVIFIAGFFFGIFWPEPMKNRLFHQDIFSKELSKTVPMQLKKMQEDIDNLKGLMIRKNERAYKYE